MDTATIYPHPRSEVKASATLPFSTDVMCYWKAALFDGARDYL